MIGQVTLRCAQPADQPFLRALYVDTHPEFSHLPAAIAADLIQLQLEAQRTGYLTSFPAATDQLIELAGVPVGRCWTHLSNTELRLLDLAVLSSHQRQGIGRTVLDGLQARAVQAGVALRLSVWQDNLAARKLYDQLGFVVQDEVNGYLSMVRT
jgi:ribosomal protein S18 acetylase RimI-like enzyme